MSSSNPTTLSPNLAVELASPIIPSSFTPPIALQVQVRVRNNFDAPVTILNWGSPLDPRANLLGVFGIRDTETDETVPLDTIKIARKLPASQEDLIHIPAGESVEAVVKLPRVVLKEGRQYVIQAKGRWHGVWEESLEDVAVKHLQTLSEARLGEYSSAAVPVHVD